MTRLILIRHGETDWNVENRRQGRNDRPLNATGEAQAQLAIEYVKANFLIDKVWSSPLQRCTNTAARFNLPVSTSDLLLELDYGEWEGMLESDIDKNYPNRYHNGKVSSDPPGGEMRSNLLVRGQQFIEESRIAEAPDQGDVVIVGHGAAMGGMLVALLDLPEHAMHNFVIDNCSVSTVQMATSESGETGKTAINQLTTLNHTTHLTPVSN